MNIPFPLYFEFFNLLLRSPPLKGTFHHQQLGVGNLPCHPWHAILQITLIASWEGKRGPASGVMICPNDITYTETPKGSTRDVYVNV